MARIIVFASSGASWNGEGSAFIGDDLISCNETPSFSINWPSWGYWKITPIEPVIEVSPATMTSPADAII